MRWGLSVIGAASLWLVSNCSSSAHAAPPASAFGRVPAMESVALSPSGHLVAWVENSGAQPIIQVLDLAKSAQVKRVDVPDGRAVTGLDWADDDILLIHARVPQLRTVAMEVATGKSRVLLHRGDSKDLVSDARLVALRTSKPHKVLMSAWSISHGVRGDHLYEVDTLTGEGVVLDRGTVDTNRWIVDGNGQAAVRSQWTEKRELYQVLHRRSDRWTEIFRMRIGEKPELIAMTRDGAAVLMRAALGRKHMAVWRVPVDGSALELAISDESHDITRVVRDPYSGELLGAWTGGLTPEIRWSDAQAEKQATSLRKTFGGKHAVLIGRSADRARALVSVGAHASPVTYYLVDFKRGTADIVGEAYPELVNVTLGEVRAMTFKARDAYDVPAYLTLPPATKPVELPLVVLPHEAPDGRDEPNFDAIAQFLATRGYAVLQPQFRGSTGFGEAHHKAGFGQWGRLMQDDVTDGARAMIEQGIADPRRVCIVGIGYGGYAALAGAAFTPELYACAISVNGIADLPKLIDHERDDLLLKYWQEYIGRGSSSEVASKSPARAASRVRAPILLMHNAEDLAVPPAQSQEMMKALGGQAPHELIELPGEDHWPSRGANLTRVLTEMERFLTKHLPVTGQAGD